MPARPSLAASGGREQRGRSQRAAGPPRSVGHPTDRSRGPVLRLSARAGGQPAVGRHQGERGAAGDLLGAELVQPALDRVVTPVGDVRRRLGRQQVARRRHLARGDRVPDRQALLLLRAVPGARQAVEVTLPEWLQAPKLGAQHLGEQRVVPVRVAVPVQADQQRVRTGQLRKRAAGSGALEDGVAEPRGESVSSTEVRIRNAVFVRAERRQELVPQVLRDEAIGPSEP